MAISGNPLAPCDCSCHEGMGIPGDCDHCRIIGPRVSFEILDGADTVLTTTDPEKAYEALAAMIEINNERYRDFALLELWDGKIMEWLV